MKKERRYQWKSVLSVCTEYKEEMENLMRGLEKLKNKKNKT